MNMTQNFKIKIDLEKLNKWVFTGSTERNRWQIWKIKKTSFLLYQMEDIHSSSKNFKNQNFKNPHWNKLKKKLIMQNLSTWNLLFLLSRVPIPQTTVKLKSVSEKNDQSSSYTHDFCYWPSDSEWEGWFF